MIDLRGQNFGRLTVITPIVERLANGNIRWLCECNCGNRIVVDGYLLRAGRTKSCGCLRIERSTIAARNNPSFSKNIGKVSNLKDYNGVFKSSTIRSKKNQSGIIGVSYDKKEDVWFARLMVNGRYVLLKSFKDFESAVAARRNAEQRYLYCNGRKQVSL